MRPRMVRSPVDICLGTRPSQAEKSRPLANAAPLPIAATIALEMIGPMPGTVITLRQLSSLFASVPISSVTVSIRSSSRRQSLARSATMRAMRGERTSVRLARMSGSCWRRNRSPCRTTMPRFQKKATNLIDHRSSLADEARPHPMQRLQIQLLVGFGGNEAGRRPLHSLGHGMSISEVILVPLPKRLCIRGRNLLHIMAKRGKLASNIVRRHSRFNANEAGWQVRKPQCDASARDLLSQHDGAARIEADQVKGVLAHIYSDGGHCVKSGRAGHGGAPFLTSPRRTLKTVGGGSAAGPSHSRKRRHGSLTSAFESKADLIRSLAPIAIYEYTP